MAGRPLRAISVKQPDATLIAIGAKRFISHPWSINYQGPLAIHASSEWDLYCDEICRRDPVKMILKSFGIKKPSDLIRGYVVCVAELVEAIPIGRVEDFCEINCVTEFDRDLTHFSGHHWCYVLGSVGLVDPYRCTPEKPVWKMSHTQTCEILRTIQEQKTPWGGMQV